MAAEVASRAFLDLLAAGGLAELGPGPRKSTLPAAKLEADLAPLLDAAGVSSSRGKLVRSVLLLWHDHLDAAHVIAQAVENADGSLVHGIVHRREPDYSNAKYWFRRAGRHPMFAGLAAKVGALALPPLGQEIRAKLLPAEKWDAHAFIDLCQSAALGEQPEPVIKLLREIQGLEFAVLLECLLER